jgi:hypothetical protein
MGQFTQYAESYTPSRLTRGIQVVVPLAFIVKAVTGHTFENILWAVFLVVIMLPAGIAPSTFQRGAAALERNHSILSGVFGFLLMSCGAFLLLRYFLDRPHSILIALPLTVGLFVFQAVRKRRTRDGS